MTLTAEDREHPAFDEQALTDGRNRGFTIGQLVACDACLRANPPTRTNCLYCDAALPFDAAHAALRRPRLKPLEEWEHGFNVILLPADAGAYSMEAMNEAASLLRLEPSQWRALTESGHALPLARAASEEESSLIAHRLRALGFHVETFSDELLGVPAHPPRRARSLAFADDALLCWTSFEGEPERVAWDDVLLLVTGRMRAKRIEVEEQRERLGGGSREIVEAREMTTDEAALDIFPAQDKGHFGWRIAAESFDYSCLDERKGLLARENFLTLLRLLRERAPTAIFDDGYERVRHLLTAAWPLTERTEAQGLRRGRGGRHNTESATHISNETQFTRYARLRWRLLLGDRQD
jgi:hypothetical protein